MVSLYLLKFGPKVEWVAVGGYEWPAKKSWLRGTTGPSPNHIARARLTNVNLDRKFSVPQRQGDTSAKIAKIRPKESN